MPNWCANRIKLTVLVYAQAVVAARANGMIYPYHKCAINQSIRMFRWRSRGSICTSCCIPR